MTRFPTCHRPNDALCDWLSECLRNAEFVCSACRTRGATCGGGTAPLPRLLSFALFLELTAKRAPRTITRIGFWNQSHDGVARKDRPRNLGCAPRRIAPRRIDRTVVRRAVGLPRGRRRTPARAQVRQCSRPLRLWNLVLTEEDRLQEHREGNACGRYEDPEPSRFWPRRTGTGVFIRRRGGPLHHGMHRRPAERSRSPGHRRHVLSRPRDVGRV